MMQTAAKGEMSSARPQADPPVVLGVAILVAVALGIFWPALAGGWLWDDAQRIVTNPIVHSPDGFWQVWLNADPQGNYYPLTSLVEWLEWRAWGGATVGYHLLSLGLHITSALLLWRLFHRLGFAYAWVGAMLFLTHPLMVESVAWISELKNTLALPPLLMAALLWLDYDGKRGAEAYRAALIWFALSLAAKTSGLMLPFFLLGHAWWVRGAISRRDVRAIAPFFALSLAAAVITLLPPHMSGFHPLAEPSWNPLSGLASIGMTAGFLLVKCFWPVGLVPDYAGLAVMQPGWGDLVPWAILALLGFVLALGWKRCGWLHPAGWGLGFFLINLVPVVVYVGLHYGEMIWSLDHLVYVPILGLIGAVIAWLEIVARRIPASWRGALWVPIVAVLVILTSGSHAYARSFARQDFFWSSLLAREPDNWRIQDDSGIYALSQNRIEDAIAHFHHAIDLQPGADQPYDHLGEALLGQDKTAEAEQAYLKAAELNPHEMKAFVALAGIKGHEGDLAGEEKYLDQARAMAPDAASPAAVLAGLMLKTGRQAEGLALYAQAVQMEPNVAQVRYNYGVALMEARDFPGAVKQLQAAVDLDGNFAPSRENLGAALAQSGAVDEAIAQFEIAVKLNPNYLAARDNLGLAYAQTGRLADAMEQFQQALAIDPNDAKARDCLAKLQSLPLAPGSKTSP